MFTSTAAQGTPTNLVLFGATGDLVAKKIVPAVYHLYKKNALPELFSVIGFSRQDLSDNVFKELIVEVLAKHKDIEPTKAELGTFLNMFIYQKGDFQNLNDYKKIGKHLDQIDTKWSTCSDKLFYLAVPPPFYKDIFNNLSESNLASSCGEGEGWTRIIVEKPFGKDLKTAQELDHILGDLFDEKQIYRIDHYLGKEMLQNILVFRFANNLMVRSWDNKSIERIDIKVLQTLGVENRGAFYDGVGALRDVGENHLLQLLALVTMQEPDEFIDTKVRAARADILSKLIPLTKDTVVTQTVRGQYKGYTEIEDVATDSSTETYFKIKAYLDDSKWQGVPISLESGKRLKETEKQVVITFKPSKSGSNRLIFDLAEDKMGIHIEFWAKRPGLSDEIEKRVLSFSLCSSDSADCFAAEAYETLLLDCIEGNQMLFISTKEVEHMWAFVDPIICAWDDGIAPLGLYEPGAANVGGGLV